MAHLYNGILLSHKKEWNCAMCEDIDRPRDYRTEWNTSERENQTVKCCLYVKSKKMVQMHLLAKQK